MKPSQWIMETQPSEASLNNARRILAQIEVLRSATRVPTLRKMWTDGTTSYEFIVSETHNRIRVWGEDETFTGFLFTYPEDGFWGVGYKKATPKYKKKPKTPLAGEIDWQGVGGKLSWKGLSRYFAYSARGTWGLPFAFTAGTGEFIPEGYRYDVFDTNAAEEDYQGEMLTGGPDVFMGGKRLCVAAPVGGSNVKVTCAVISPDKTKMLLGYSAFASNDYRETFLMLPFPPPAEVNPQTPGVLAEVSRIMVTQYSLPGDPYDYDATFTAEEAEYLWTNFGGAWRFNASGTMGYGERLATRQRIDVVWDTDYEEITITAEAAAWVHNDHNITGAPVIRVITILDYTSVLWDGYIYPASTFPKDASGNIIIQPDWVFVSALDNDGHHLESYEIPLYTYVKRGEYFKATFCDFDWDTLVEGYIEVDSATTRTDGTETYTLETTHEVSISVAGEVLHSVTLLGSEVWGSDAEGSSVRLSNTASGVFTFFHWVDLRVRGLSVDTHSGAGGVVSSIENWTYIGGVRVVTTEPVSTSYDMPVSEIVGVSLAAGTLSDAQTLIDYTVSGFDLSLAPQPLPLGMILPTGDLTDVESAKQEPIGYIQTPYVHHSGLGVAETGIKVYYLSPTDKRCVWGIANLPSAHLNEVQTYTYGSDDESTAAQLKGVGADGLLLNIYII